MQPAFLQSLLRRAAMVGALVSGAISVTAAADWPEWRGPSRDGRSAETGLPSSWSPKGENLAWRIPLGSRSSPVVFGNRLYLLSPNGDLPNKQERRVAIDAVSGKGRGARRFRVS